MVDFAAHTSRIINRIGSPISVTPDGQAAKVVSAVFVQDPAVAFGLIDGVNPMVRLTTQDAAGLINGDPVSISGSSYIVSRVREDIPAGDVLVELESA